MRKMIGAATGVSSIAAAIVIYMTVIRATEGEAYVLPYVIASVALLLLTAALAALSSLTGRVESLERDVKRLLDDDYEVPQPTEYEMGDDGGAPSFAAHLSHGEYFATEDPDYKGTDFSEEEYVSANTDGEEQDRL